MERPRAFFFFHKLQRLGRDGRRELDFFRNRIDETLEWASLEGWPISLPMRWWIGQLRVSQGCGASGAIFTFLAGESPGSGAAGMPTSAVAALTSNDTSSTYQLSGRHGCFGLKSAAGPTPGVGAQVPHTCSTQPGCIGRGAESIPLDGRTVDQKSGPIRGAILMQMSRATASNASRNGLKEW